MVTLANSKIDKLYNQFQNLEQFYKDVANRDETRLDFLARVFNLTNHTYNKDRATLLKDKVKYLYQHSESKDNEYKYIIGKIDVIDRVLKVYLGGEFSLSKETLERINQDLSYGLSFITSEDTQITERTLDNRRLTSIPMFTQFPTPSVQDSLQGYYLYYGKDFDRLRHKLKHKQELTPFDRGAFNLSLSLDKTNRTQPDTLYLFVDKSLRKGLTTRFKRGSKEVIDIKAGVPNSPKAEGGTAKVLIPDLNISIEAQTYFI